MQGVHIPLCSRQVPGSGIFAGGPTNSANWVKIGGPTATNDVAEPFLGQSGGLDIISGGASWHRARSVALPFQGGRDYFASMFFRFGTSGAVRVFLYKGSTTPATDLYATFDSTGAMTFAKEQAGQIFHTHCAVVSDPVWRLDIGFRVDSSLTEGIAVGPAASTAGENVVLYHSQIGTAGFSPIPITSGMS